MNWQIIDRVIAILDGLKRYGPKVIADMAEALEKNDRPTREELDAWYQLATKHRPKNEEENE